MNYISFEKALKKFPVFSVRDIDKLFPDFDSRRLVEWQQKGFLLKIRRGYYCFMARKGNEQFNYFVANKIYSPSYVSLESALAYYSLIPEGVFITTSVTTKNTAEFDTFISHFHYRHLKPILYFGYRLLQEKEVTIKIAEPEKVILDYFYFNTLNNIEDIAAMRFNEVLVKELIDFDKLHKYQRIFNSKILNKRIQMFLRVINA